MFVCSAMLSFGAAWAQRPQEAVDASSSQKAPVPLPDRDGIYGVVDGIVPPVMVTPASPVFPASVTTELANPLNCMLSAVIGMDGMPNQVQIVQGCNEVFSKSAIDSVYPFAIPSGNAGGQAGSGAGVCARDIPDPLFANAPRLALRYREIPGDAGPSAKLYDTPPKPIRIGEAEFSDKARRERIQGNVAVSLIVDERGLPTDVHVIRGVGAGLDEQAVKAVRQYRFQPAMKDGKPVAAKISLEVRFRLYTRQ